MLVAKNRRMFDFGGYRETLQQVMRNRVAQQHGLMRFLTWPFVIASLYGVAEAAEKYAHVKPISVSPTNDAAHEGVLPDGAELDDASTAAVASSQNDTSAVSRGPTATPPELASTTSRDDVAIGQMPDPAREDFGEASSKAACGPDTVGSSTSPELLGASETFDASSGLSIPSPQIGSDVQPDTLTVALQSSSATIGPIGQGLLNVAGEAVGALNPFDILTSADALVPNVVDLTGSAIQSVALETISLTPIVEDAAQSLITHDPVASLIGPNGLSGIATAAQPLTGIVDTVAVTHGSIVGSSGSILFEDAANPVDDLLFSAGGHTDYGIELGSPADVAAPLIVSNGAAPSSLDLPDALLTDDEPTLRPADEVVGHLAHSGDGFL